MKLTSTIRVLALAGLFLVSSGTSCDPPDPSPPPPKDVEVDHRNYFDDVDSNGVPIRSPSRRILDLTSPCGDAALTDAVRSVAGTAPTTALSCDRRLYGASGLTGSSLAAAVRSRLETSAPDSVSSGGSSSSGPCADPAVTLAYLETERRLPQGWECDIRLYDGGDWGSFERLKSDVDGLTEDAGHDHAWRVLALVYAGADLGPEYTGTALHTRACQGEAAAPCLGFDQIADTDEVLRSYERDANSWSRGNAKLHLTIVHPPGTLTHLTLGGTSTLGSQWMVKPEDVRGDLDRFAPFGGYDSVIVAWPRTDMSGNSLPVSYVGLGEGVAPDSASRSWNDGSNGATFAQVVMPPPAERWGANADGAFVHEWLHGVEQHFLSWTSASGNAEWGDALPPPQPCPIKDGISGGAPYTDTSFLHSAECHKFFDRGGSWQDWYTAVLTGDVPNNRCTGDVSAKVAKCEELPPSPSSSVAGINTFGVFFNMWERGGPRTYRDGGSILGG